MWTETLQSTATNAASLAAIIGLFVLVSRLRPVRWFGRTVVTEPVGRWVSETVRDEVNHALEDLRTEFRPNGGSSMADKVTRLEVKVDRIAEWIDDQR